MTASTLYLNHFQLKRPPFDQEADTRLFFPAAGREAILNNLLADIENGKPLVKLTGSEGTGKTLMCHLLEHNLDPEKYQFVSLDYPIGSYDNFLRTVCLALGTVEEGNDDEESVSPDYSDLFKAHLQWIEAGGQNLVLLVDESENLFLATLERLIRMICDADHSSNLQILLVGRLELDAHIDQLAIYCSNVDITSGYRLKALNLDETRQYIHFRLDAAGLPRDKYLDLFTEDAIEMIYQTAMGNISLTNSLAEQGLKKACEQGKFQVDEELILSQQRMEDNFTLALSQGYDFVKENKWWLLGGTILVWSILMLLWPAGEPQKSLPDDEEQLEIMTTEQEILIPPAPDVTEFVEPKVISLDDESETKKSQEIPQDKQVETIEPVVDEQLEKRQLVPKKNIRVTDTPAPVIEVQPLEQKKAVYEKKEPVVIKPERRKKIVLVQPLKEMSSSPPVKETEVLPGPVETPAMESAMPVRDAQALFNERVKASSKWLAWAYRGGFTIQLMVLASDSAEENLKKILVDDKYFAIKDELFILRKRSPQTVYVFYGNYPSMNNARQARNDMPQFLRDNQPYVLSIEDALEKVQE